MTLPTSRLRGLMFVSMALLLSLTTAGGCGREAPAAPEDPGAPDTQLTVESSPAGAAIVLDGEDTGEVTPHVFIGLPTGEVVVALDLPGYLVTPAATTVALVEGEEATVPADVFTTRSLRLVMLEGFANIDCIPCPQLTDNLVILTARPEYGPDRVAFVEFAVFWPNFQDPFYLFNDTETNERIQAYGPKQAPTLVVDGFTLDSAVDFELMRGAVDAALALDPGVLVDVSADFAGNDVPVTVTVTALRDVDLTGHTLYVALYQNALTMAPAPGINGQTEFHHIFRDREDDLPALGNLTAGDESVHTVNVVQGDWGNDATTVFAYIQNDEDKSILQAGSTAQTVHAAASLFTRSQPQPTVQEGPLP